MPITKEFKTIDEQISGLVDRGLKFKDKKKAAEILKRYNYFDVVNGFESILLKKNTVEKTYEKVYFEDFRDLYFFDMQLKKCTLFKIFDIESRLRTSIAYNFAEEYCRTSADTMNYTNPVYYKVPCSTDKHMKNIFSTFDLFRTTQLSQSGRVKRKSFIDELKKDRDYVCQYTEPPFWVVIKALPLGSLYYTFVFLDDTVKAKVLRDFGFELSEAAVFEQALFVLKEVRNQCAHLELITRFRLKRKANLNYMNDITIKASLSHDKLNYLDVVKIFVLFGNVADIKKVVAMFYIKMVIKGRKNIADKALAMMGRKKFDVWMKVRKNVNK